MLSSQRLLPILQTIRQEGFNALSNLLNGGDPHKRFDRALVSPLLPDALYSFRQLKNLDEFTFGWGLDGKDHNGGLLARNACHFAPHTWYRWKYFHKIAATYAGVAHAATDKQKSKELEDWAWVYHGYADHFLQDAFAAGHLINKPLVMQWFIEWAVQQGADVADLGLLREMVTSAQPLLAGAWLYDAGPMYDRGFEWVANDPQTAQEAGTVVARYLSSNLLSRPDTSDFETYQAYLTFVTGVAA